MISEIVGRAARMAASLESNSLPTMVSARAASGALGSGANLTPTLHPPGSDRSAPPCQPVVLPPSLSKPLSFNGLPLTFPTAARPRSSGQPFGLVHVDRPLTTTRQ